MNGKNLVIESRFTEGKDERTDELVKELVQMKVNLLVTPTGTAARSAKQATRTIPIVMITQLDPVETGLVDSLARPGGNLTGLARLQRQLSGKRLELLKEAVPRLARIALLHDPENIAGKIGLSQYRAAAEELKVQLYGLEAQDQKTDLDKIFKEASSRHADALVTVTSTLLFQRQREIAALAGKNRLPSMFEGSSWLDMGGMMSYSTDDVEVFHRAAVFVDKILKGAKPGDLPIEQPTKFELVINLKTARRIAITIPPNLLARADRVIR